LINDSDIIIGTTGTDCLKGIAFDRLKGHKILASASSADVEFASLLKFAEPTDRPFEARTVRVHETFTAEILNGGYPINFDRQKDATPSEDIVLTRALMYVAAMQAVALIQQGELSSDIYGVDPLSQERLLEKWIEFKASLGMPVPINKSEVRSLVEAGDLGRRRMTSGVWRD
jgi:hypothetical protein